MAKNQDVLIKTHRAHRVLTYVILIVLAVSMVVSIGTYMASSGDVLARDSNALVITLLFLMNFNLIVLIVMFLWFATDIKDALYEEEGLLTRMIKRKK